MHIPELKKRKKNTMTKSLQLKYFHSKPQNSNDIPNHNSSQSTVNPIILVKFGFTDNNTLVYLRVFVTYSTI